MVRNCLWNYTNQLILQIGRADGYNPQSGRGVAFQWANVYEQDTNSSLALGNRMNVVLSNMHGSYDKLNYFLY